MSSVTTIDRIQQGIQIGETASDIYKGIQRVSTGLSGARSVASGVEGSSSAAGNGSVYLSAAQTAVNVASILAANASGKAKAIAVRDQVGLAVADWYTFGLASKVYAFGQKHWPGTMQKISNFWYKTDFGQQLFAKLVSWGDKDMWKTEQNRIKDLVEKGIQVARDPNEPLLTRGRSTDELLDHSVPMDFVGFNSEGGWVNNKFTNSRNESDLKPQDIWGSAALYEKFGNDWLGSFTAEQREAICGKALELGAVREHHGTIDINWTPELEQAVNLIK